MDIRFAARKEFRGPLHNVRALLHNTLTSPFQKGLLVKTKDGTLSLTGPDVDAFYRNREK